MQEESQDPRFERDYGATTGAPMGRFPIPDGSGLRVVECIHCTKPLGLTTWDYLNGFLVVCPHCRGYHGKPWSIQRTLIAGLFLSVLSFFITMRPRHAFATVLAFGSVCAALVWMASQDDLNTAKMATAIWAIFLGPVLINAVMLVRHQMRLDAAPPSREGGARA